MNRNPSQDRKNENEKWITTKICHIPDDVQKWKKSKKSINQRIICVLDWNIKNKLMVSGEDYEMRSSHPLYVDIHLFHIREKQCMHISTTKIIQLHLPTFLKTTGPTIMTLTHISLHVAHKEHSSVNNVIPGPLMAFGGPVSQNSTHLRPASPYHVEWALARLHGWQIFQKKRNRAEF